MRDHKHATRRVVDINFLRLESQTFLPAPTWKSCTMATTLTEESMRNELNDLFGKATPLKDDIMNEGERVLPILQFS